MTIINLDRPPPLIQVNKSTLNEGRIANTWIITCLLTQCRKRHSDSEWDRWEETETTEISQKYVQEEENIKREDDIKNAIEEEKQKAEQKADNHHWLIHQHFASNESYTEFIESREFLKHSRTALDAESDKTWFDEALQDNLIEVIPYDDVEKDSANPLGRGDNGSVYSAMWNELMVAIKVFYKSSTFYHEMRILKTIGEHDNIIHVLGATM